MSVYRTPAQYAAQYLPVTVPSAEGNVQVNVGRYHIGGPSSGAKDALWGAVGAHFAAMQKTNPGYRLELSVNGLPTLVASREQIRYSLINPFFGKGSPEDVQVALQLALRLRVVTRDRLQAWADANIGLDCNGFVGNYIMREIMGNPWWLHQRGAKTPGPSAAITAIFEWAAGHSEESALADTSQIDASVPHLFARVDSAGHVMPGGKVVGHVGLTEPGMKMDHSFVSDSMGGLDLKSAQQGLYGKFALRSVESAGQHSGGIKVGVSQNWLIFLGKVSGQPKVFEVIRDNIRHRDFIKIAPLPGW
jgi:hypothetical protein